MSTFTFLLISDVTFILMALSSLFGTRFTRNLKTAVFATMVAVLALLTLARPLGIGADDYYYVQMAQDAGDLSLPDLLGIYERDPVYFYLLHHITQFAGVRALMVIASIVFLLKAFFISKLVQDRLFALYAYFCLSFFLQEVIQFRASLATMFMFSAIYFFQRSSNLVTLASGVAAGLSHYSGYAVFLLLKTMKARPLLYMAPLAMAVVSLLGIPGLASSVVSRYLPEILFITRYLEDENRLFQAGFNSATIALYLAIAISGKRIVVSRSSSTGLLAVNLSALVVLLFKDIVTFAVRLNELFLTFYTLNVGNFRDDRTDLRRVLLVAALGLFYMRWRWIGLISYQPI